MSLLRFPDSHFTFMVISPSFQIGSDQVGQDFQHMSLLVAQIIIKV